MIALPVGRAIASFSPGSRTAIQTVLLAREHSQLQSDPLVRYADHVRGNVYSGNEEQDGPSQINILITNHCPDCTMITVDGQVQGHFDINNAPNGWSNPRIYYMQVVDSQCT